MAGSIGAAAESEAGWLKLKTYMIYNNTGQSRLFFDFTLSADRLALFTYHHVVASILSPRHVASLASPFTIYDFATTELAAPRRLKVSNGGRYAKSFDTPRHLHCKACLRVCTNVQISMFGNTDTYFS